FGEESSRALSSIGRVSSQTVRPAGTAGRTGTAGEQIQILRSPESGDFQTDDSLDSLAEDLWKDGDESRIQREMLSKTKGASYGFQMHRDELFAGQAVHAVAGLSGRYAMEDLDKAMIQLVTTAPPRTYFPEVAYWNPRVVTDDAGKASVTIVTPDSSTKWKLIARGVTKDTLVGGGDAEVVSKHDFFVELLTPATLVEGEHFRVAARVHCLTPYKGKVRVTLQANAGLTDGREPLMEMKEEIDFETAGIQDVEFREIPVPANDVPKGTPLPAGRLRLECTGLTAG